MLEHILFTALLILVGLVIIGLAMMPLSLVVGGWAYLSSKANQHKAAQLSKLQQER